MASGMHNGASRTKSWAWRARGGIGLRALGRRMLPVDLQCPDSQGGRQEEPPARRLACERRADTMPDPCRLSLLPDIFASRRLKGVTPAHFLLFCSAPPRIEQRDEPLVRAARLAGDALP